jgi:hypothetical protein
MWTMFRVVEAGRGARLAVQPVQRLGIGARAQHLDRHRSAEPRVPGACTSPWPGPEPSDHLVEPCARARQTRATMSFRRQGITRGGWLRASAVRAYPFRPPAKPGMEDHEGREVQLWTMAFLADLGRVTTQ